MFLVTLSQIVQDQGLMKLIQGTHVVSALQALVSNLNDLVVIDGQVLTKSQYSVTNTSRSQPNPLFVGRL